jgi:hypothetical protein
MTDWRSTYNDLCKEIEILELRAGDLEFQMKMARKVCFTGFINDQYSRIPLDKALHTYDDVKDELLAVESMLEHKRLTKRQIEQKMSEFDGLEYQVAYRRDVLRQPLDRIADDLGYSYNWIMKISARTTYRVKGRKKAEPA